MKTPLPYERGNLKGETFSEQLNLLEFLQNKIYTLITPKCLVKFANVLYCKKKKVSSKARVELKTEKVSNFLGRSSFWGSLNVGISNPRAHDLKLKLTSSSVPCIISDFPNGVCNWRLRTGWGAMRLQKLLYQGFVEDSYLWHYPSVCINFLDY